MRDHPHPPAVHSARRTRIEVRFAGVLIASAAEAARVLETSHPPVHYPPG
ncbi:DUF427 domain-containing protein [Kitasatospora sp. NPDC058263]